MIAGRPPLSAAGRALRHRNFRLFFGGELVSITGSWIQYTAQAWLVVTLVGNASAAFYLGLLGAAQVLPVLVLGLFGGIIADVLPKRRTVIATQTAAGLLALAMGLLVYLGVAQVWHVFVVGFALGIVNAVDIPTRQAFVVDMVGPEDVGNAITLNSAAFNVARIVGPSVGGLLIAAVGMSLCFLLNALSFAAVVVSLLAMRDSELLAGDRLPMPKSVREVRAHLAEGLSYVRRTPVVLLAIGAGGLAATFGMNFAVVVPAMAAGVLNVGPTGFGFLNAAIGVGAVLVAFPVAAISRPTPRLLIGGIIVLGVSLAGLSISTSFPMAMVTIAIAGAAGLVLAVTANSLVQMAPPAPLRGRVMSVFTTAFIGSTPVGNTLIGVAAELSSTRVAVLLAGSMTLLIGVIAAGVVLAGRVPDAIDVNPERAPQPVLDNHD
jgi:MFS family permease